MGPLWRAMLDLVWNGRRAYEAKNWVDWRRDGDSAPFAGNSQPPFSSSASPSIEQPGWPRGQHRALIWKHSTRTTCPKNCKCSRLCAICARVPSGAPPSANCLSKSPRLSNTGGPLECAGSVSTAPHVLPFAAPWGGPRVGTRCVKEWSSLGVLGAWNVSAKVSSKGNPLPRPLPQRASAG